MLPDPVFFNIHMYGVMIAVGILCAFLTPSQFWSVLMLPAGVAMIFVMNYLLKKGVQNEKAS